MELHIYAFTAGVTKTNHKRRLIKKLIHNHDDIRFFLPHNLMQRIQGSASFTCMQHLLKVPYARVELARHACPKT